jgi:peptidyl-prolyl cis-trans isomerase SurA
MNNEIIKSNFQVKLLGFFIFSSLLLISPQKISAKIELLDRIAVIVDSGIIMESELNKRTKEIIGRLRETSTPLPPEKILTEQILERMIIEEIQLQIGDKAGVRISDAELNESLNAIASQNSLSIDEFRKSVEGKNISYRDLRETIKKEMIIQRVQRGKVGARVDISEQEIENFLNSEEGQVRLSEEYRIQQILIPLKKNASNKEKETAEKKVTEISTRYSDGEEFEKLAAIYSADQSALEGGEMGWKKLVELPTLFEPIVKNLSLNSLSTPLRSGAGLHILRLVEKRGDSIKFEDQTLARHILVKPSEIRTKKQTEQLISTISDQLKNEGDFSKLAKEFSEDPGSKMDGGNLGWNVSGVYDPVFAKILDSTNIGETSEPFESSFGWHILEVLDRRNEDVSEEVRKNRAFQLIYGRKYEEELQRTLIELRSEAYVDIKISL